MSKTSTFMVSENTNLVMMLQMVEQQLRGQGFDVNVIMMNPNCATVTVGKDRSGIQNVIGLGIECRATISMMPNNAVTVNIDSEWSNKIIAMAVGWFVCLIPFITGIVGCVNQNSLPDKVMAAVQTAATCY